MNNRFIITLNVDKDAINFCNRNQIFGKWGESIHKVSGWREGMTGSPRIHLAYWWLKSERTKEL